MDRSLTTTTRPLAAGLAGLALVLGLGLSGCSLVGGGSEPPAEASSEPGAPASTGTGTGTDEAGDRPSREEVAAGLGEVIVEMAPSIGEASQDVLDQLTDCAVGKIYDSASSDSLQAIADGNLSGASPETLTALSNAVSACSTELTGG